jgi:large subunit ribosomal protein L23Ae
MDKYNIIKYPLCTESAMKQIEDNNVLTFIVDGRANKRHIAAAIKAMYEIDVIRVNTLIRCVLTALTLTLIALSAFVNISLGC